MGSQHDDSHSARQTISGCLVASRRSSPPDPHDPWNIRHSGDMTMSRLELMASGRASILIATLTLASPAPTWANQDPRGATTGRVTDPSGATIADAEVRATNVATGVAAVGTTSAAGVFSIPFLLPGTYAVTVELPGFRRFVRDNLQIRVSETVEVNIPMEVGAVAETMEVRQTSPVLETAGASLGHVIDERRIQELPVVAGNPLELALLAPGVVEGTRFIWKPAFSFHQVAIDGNGALNNEFQIDGVANTFAEVDNGRS